MFPWSLCGCESTTWSMRTDRSSAPMYRRARPFGPPEGPSAAKRYENQARLARSDHECSLLSAVVRATVGEQRSRHPGRGLRARCRRRLCAPGSGHSGAARAGRLRSARRARSCIDDAAWASRGAVSDSRSTASSSPPAVEGAIGRSEVADLAGSSAPGAAQATNTPPLASNQSQGFDYVANLSSTSPVTRRGRPCRQSHLSRKPSQERVRWSGLNVVLRLLSAARPTSCSPTVPTVMSCTPKRSYPFFGQHSSYSVRVTFCSARGCDESGMDRAVVGGGSAAFLAVLIATPVWGLEYEDAYEYEYGARFLALHETLEHDHLNPIRVDGSLVDCLATASLSHPAGIAVLGSWPAAAGRPFGRRRRGAGTVSRHVRAHRRGAPHDPRASG